ncbi:hypothetical protein L3X38_027339 [Prunus dulcis]|uniref:Uncharacterized protein n=1 Tax=Prunus dulcis TaxID=3755 RepID=A0AAD4VP00_PRUDU|nr:hypothetical protein L3X38_027339 [Prunus dulcis]
MLPEFSQDTHALQVRGPYLGRPYGPEMIHLLSRARQYARILIWISFDDQSNLRILGVILVRYVRTLRSAPHTKMLIYVPLGLCRNSRIGNRGPRCSESLIQRLCKTVTVLSCDRE